MTAGATSRTGVRVWTHDDLAPDLQEVVDVLDLPVDGDFLYLVATTAQQRRRRCEIRKGAPSPRPQAGRYGQPDLYFPHALRTLLRRAGVSIVSRIDERVALSRSVRPMAGEDEDLELQLRHDLAIWNQALRDAWARGIETEHDAAAIPDVDVRKLLLGLQAEVGERVGDGRTFEQHQRGLVSNPPEARRVVFDGFSLVTSLQLDMVRSWSQNAMVDVLLPYREEQSHGFAAIGRAWSEFWDARQVWPNAPVAQTASSVSFARARLFADESTDSVPRDDSLTIWEYSHRQREVEACIAEVKALLAQDAKAEIAIVVHDLAGYRPLIAEEARRQGIGVTVSDRPEMLLLTPPGRFVLAIYGAWDPNMHQLRLSAAAFEEMLISGAFGVAAQATLERFRAVAVQLFALCESADDWHASFDYLDRLRAGRTRLPQTWRPDTREPARIASDEDLRLWRDAVDHVEKLGAELFEPGERSIGAHVDRLLAVVNDLPTAELLAVEREVITRVGEVIEKLRRAAQTALDAEEFGSLLAGLAREREQEAEEEEEEEESDLDRAEDGSGDQRPDAVWVTTLRGVDGVGRSHIFLLGADDRRMPMPFAPGWPFTDKTVDDHVAEQRYLFLTAIRAARERLRISFSRTDMERKCLPSLYVEIVASLADAGISEDTAHRLGQEDPPLPPEPLSVERPLYQLEELAHFGSCPFRYKLERLTPERRAYETPFQVRLLAGAAWIDLALSKLEEDGGAVSSKDDLVQALFDALDTTRGSLLHRFPALTAAEILTLNRRLRFSITRESGVLWFDTVGASRFERSDVEDIDPIEVHEGRRQIRIAGTNWRHAVVQRRGKWRAAYPIWEDIFRQEWLIRSDSDDQTEPPVIAEVPLFVSRRDAWLWYERALRAVQWHYPGHENYDEVSERATELVHALEAGEFPRNPGHRCHFCTVREPCMGIGDPRLELIAEHRAGLGRPDVEVDIPVPGGTLTDQQERILDRVRSGGLTVVSAGAGSGKTYTMIESILDLIKDGADSSQFALVTFTNTAADELRVRLDRALRHQYETATCFRDRHRWLNQEERLSAAYIGTIHGLCSEILQRYGYAVGVPHSASRTTSVTLLEEALANTLDDAFTGREGGYLTADASVVEEITWDAHEFLGELEEIVGECRTSDVPVVDVVSATSASSDDAGRPYRLGVAEVVAEGFVRYEAVKRVDAVVDAEDLLQLTRRLLSLPRGESVVAAVAERYRYLFVDEFQDTDPIQAAVIRKLEPALEAVLLVGDEKQAIYGFRSAQPALLFEFARAYHRRSGENGSPLDLNIARRPTEMVLRVQNAFFELLSQRSASYAELAKTLEASTTPLRPRRPLPPLIVDSDKQPANVAAYIDAFLDCEIESKQGIRRRVAPGDIAVLVRSNWKVQNYERDVTRALTDLGRDVAVVDDTGGFFYTRPEIVSTQKLLRLLLSPTDDCILSLALETPYLREATGWSATEADMLAVSAPSGALRAWLEEQHPDVTVKVDRLAAVARAVPVIELLSHVFDEFAIRPFYEGLGHVRALENLEKLRELTRRLFREERALTLRAFTDYLGQAIVRQFREPDADTTPAGSSSRPPYVRVMTIHQAKGREFPIVLIPGAQTPLAHSERAPGFIIHDDKELDLRAPTESGVDTRSSRYDAEIRRSRETLIAEEIRLLYVAMTRAEQAMVVLGGEPAPVNGPGSDFYAWKDELWTARATLEAPDLGAIYRNNPSGPPPALLDLAV
jgi:DNA helicase-2/ATP-dependent DNA helicase PcrA